MERFLIGMIAVAVTWIVAVTTVIVHQRYTGMTYATSHR